MNDSTEPFDALEHSISDPAQQIPSNINPNIFLPSRIYDALPIGYMSAGALLILGAMYVGIDHWPMVGYLAVGLSCIFAGVTVNSIRNKEQPTPEDALA